MSAAEDQGRAPWGRDEDGRPFLPMGAHWTDIPELVDRHLSGIQARVEQAQPGIWFVSPTAAAPGTVCTQYDGYTRTVGRFANMLPSDLEMVLHAHTDLRWLLELVAKLRSRPQHPSEGELAEQRHLMDPLDHTLEALAPRTTDVSPQVQQLRDLLAGQRAAVETPLPHPTDAGSAL